VKISGRNKIIYRFWFVGIKTDVIIKRGKGELVLKKNPGRSFFRTY